jgi:hypothetical protein
VNVRKISGADMLRLFGRDELVSTIKKDRDFFLITSNGHLIVREEIPSDPYVVVVTKNADFTEGRGPMVFDKVFTGVDSAVEYIKNQSGIYGSQQGSSNYSGVNIYGTPYCVSGFNGYDIILAPIHKGKVL